LHRRSKQYLLALFGLYEVIDAVNTIDPFVFNLMNIRAAAVAQFQAPNT
jgi:hypothetical protein